MQSPTNPFSAAHGNPPFPSCSCPRHNHFLLPCLPLIPRVSPTRQPPRFQSKSRLPFLLKFSNDPPMGFEYNLSLLWWPHGSWCSGPCLHAPLLSTALTLATLFQSYMATGFDPAFGILPSSPLSLAPHSPPFSWQFPFCLLFQGKVFSSILLDITFRKLQMLASFVCMCSPRDGNVNTSSDCVRLGHHG